MRILKVLLRQSRAVSFMVVVAVVALQLAITLPAAFANDPFEPLCHGLQCNDESDCGSLCFCNNPYDEVGTCIPDM